MYQDKPRRKFHPVYLILLIPYIAGGVVPFFNRIEPQLWGIPFFYWWQIFCIFVTAACITPVYFHQEGRGK